MPVAVCYICVFKDPIHRENQSPVYADCARCEKATCAKHGRDTAELVFYCIRCLRELGLA